MALTVGERTWKRAAAGAMGAALVLAGVTGCGGVGSSRSPEVDYPSSVLGHAQLMRDFSPRIVKVVDVGTRYPDPDGEVRGAVVLVDRRLGRGLSTTDYRRRPVLVRYASASAAQRATRRLPDGTYGLGWSDVVMLPAHFPADASRAYVRAVGVALQ